MTQEKRTDAGLLRNLLRSTGGNVLAITAAATLPMLGVIGGAVDISRIYMTKSRLQAACDSAVLAGRKAMTTTTYTAAAKNRAESMFRVNFQDEDQGTRDTSFVSSGDADGKVSGTVQTTVPMVLMQIFGTTANTVTATCSADIQIPNIDVVLVLDVTGSMDSSIGGVKKINSLKEAAKEFYVTLADAMAGNTTSQIRYGLVPYDEAVNVADVFKSSPDFDKGELPLSHLASTMTVQSRRAYMNTWTSRWVPDPASTPTVYTQRFANGTDATKKPFETSTPTGTTIRNDDCTRYGDNQSFQINGNPAVNVTLHPATTTYPGEGSGYSVLYRSHNAAPNTTQNTEPTTGSFYTRITFKRTGFTGSSGNSSTGTCTREVTHTRYIKEEGYRFTSWDYMPLDYDVSSYRSGSAISYLSAIDTNKLVPTSGKYDLVQLAGMGVGTTSTTTWNGCVEERNTVAASTFTPIPANAYDLNSVDGGTSQQTRWRPALRDLTHDRQQTGNRNNTTTNYGNPAFSCPSARMQSLNVMTKAQFDAHINSLQPGGNTYLDVGMIWGLRLIAPQGMFAARNLTGPNGGQISRHLIFLTDGEPVSADTRYTAYGVERMEKRITGSTGVAQATLHSRRFQALCDSQRGAVSIWAIAFGTSVTGNLQNCADPGRAFQADNTAQLKDAFKRIAKEVADLRLVE